MENIRRKKTNSTFKLSMNGRIDRIISTDRIISEVYVQKCVDWDANVWNNGIIFRRLNEV